MKLLVVEDDKKLAIALKRGLEAEKYAVEIALDGPTGLWLASESSFDLIILDLMLPNHERHARQRRTSDLSPTAVRGGCLS